MDWGWRGLGWRGIGGVRLMDWGWRAKLRGFPLRLIGFIENERRLHVPDRLLLRVSFANRFPGRYRVAGPGNKIFVDLQEGLPQFLCLFNAVAEDLSGRCLRVVHFGPRRVCFAGAMARRLGR